MNLEMNGLFKVLLNLILLHLNSGLMHWKARYSPLGGKWKYATLQSPKNTIATTSALTAGLLFSKIILAGLGMRTSSRVARSILVCFPKSYVHFTKIW